MAAPTWRAVYTDSSLVAANRAFPAVANYSDGRILLLMLAAIVCFVLLAWYCSGRMPPAMRKLDVMTGGYELMPATSGLFQPVSRSSKFGGLSA